MPHKCAVSCRRNSRAPDAAEFLQTHSDCLVPLAKQAEAYAVIKLREVPMRMQFAFALVAAIAAASFAGPGRAADTAQQANMKSCAANWNGMSAVAKSKTTYKDFMSTCLKAPASTAAATPAAMTSKPAAATTAAMTAKPAAKESGSAKCKDGKTVTYTHRSGTCSGHGGVATWM